MIEIRSCAKINLGLNIVRKREDGFHDIETIFYPIGLSDVLTFEPKDKFVFTTDSQILANDTESNLIVKSLRLLERVTARELPVSISLQKNIPMGAGLGGGSSNAAVTLLSLNEMFHLAIQPEQLASLALALGSDVPFFLGLDPAFAAGRGEVLTRINLKLPLHLVLVCPRVHVSTAWAYSQISVPVPDLSLAKAIHGGVCDWSEVQPLLKNDFEPAVFAAYPELGSIKNRLVDCGACYAQMSGSGSSIFGLFEYQHDAFAAHSELAREYFTYLEYYENTN